MNKLRTFMQGKKAILVALSAMIGVVIAWAEGAMADKEAIEAMVLSIFGLFLRTGMKNEMRKILQQLTDEK